MARRMAWSRRGPTGWDRLGVLRQLIGTTRSVGVLLRSLLQGSSEVAGITVHGPQGFREQVAAALRLLDAEAPESFRLCERYFGMVIMSRHSGVDVQARPVIVMLGEWAASASPRYVACTLAHEAFHCRLYWSYREDHPGAHHVPREVFSGENAERECLEYQIEVLRQLGGTDQEASGLRDSLKTEYWKVPWLQRTW